LEIQEPLEVKPGEVRCPRCFSRDLAPSKPRGALDLLMRWFKRVPRHCRFCGKRFYAVEKPTGVPLP
jgi:DNA-directed RNA polymerase subunit RPC12/RpoP